MSEPRRMPIVAQVLLWGLANTAAGVALGLAIAILQDEGLSSPVIGMAALQANVVGFSVMLASFLLFPRLRNLHPVTGAVLMVLAIAGATTLGSMIVVTQFFLFVVRDFRLAPVITGLTVVTGLIVGGVVYVYEGLRSRLAESLREVEQVRLAQAQLREAAVRAELAALQARINPHFFFNTLNTISSLLEEDPARAEDVLQKLAGLFRYTFRAAQSGPVALRDEIGFVRGYLEIERARFGERLNIEWALDEATLDTPLPGLILQPLVENAVSHGIAPRPDGGTVRVSSALSEGTLSVRVEDDGGGLPSDRRDLVRDGHGLGNVVRRLRTLYGERARLELRSREGRSGSCVELFIPSGGTDGDPLRDRG